MATSWLDTFEEDDLPPGAIRDYDSPNGRGIAFIVVTLVYFLLSTSFGGVRIYTKAFITRALGWDDYTCLCTMLGNVVWTIDNIFLVSFGMGRDIWNVHNTPRMWNHYEHADFVANLIYFLIIMFVKISILFLYLRTFTEGRLYRLTVIAVLTVLVTSHTGFVICMIFFFYPPSCYWRHTETDEEWDAVCSELVSIPVIRKLLIWIALLTVILDVVILILPCRPVLRLHLPKRQKLVILISLIAGVVQYILRLVYLFVRLYTDNENETHRAWKVNLISTIEINTALICTCLPVLKAFTRRFFPSLLRLWSSSDNSTHGNSQGARRPKSQQLPLSRKRDADSHEDKLVSNAAYLELGEDGKSDQAIAMNNISVESRQV